MSGPTTRPTAASRSPAPLRWVRDLRLGASMAFSGGRESRVRLALIASGIGVAVALLLGAASVPNMVDARQERDEARSYKSPQEISPGEPTLLIGTGDTSYHGDSVYGRLLAPEGPQAPVPPGVAEIPDPGEMVVSPALQRLLDSPEGKLLRERLDYRVVGTIGDEGLIGPGELAYYAGASPETLDPEPPAGGGSRIDGFGESLPEFGLGNAALMLVLTGAVAALLPLGVFVAAALRYGADRRDHRLAVLRLLGADKWTAARTASGETLVGALAGIAAGAALYVPLRRLVPQLRIGGVDGFAADVVPHPLLAVAVLLGVLGLAVGVTLVSSARAAAHPLGTVRRASRPRRRLWWRLALLAGGAALLAPFVAGTRSLESSPPNGMVAGVALVLLGAAATTPWLFQVVVSRMRGGGVARLLAVRRLRADGTAESRAMAGVVVVVAGAIALQTLFAGIVQRFDDDGAPPLAETEHSLYVPGPSPAEIDDTVARLRGLPQTRDVRATVEYGLEAPAGWVEMSVGSCAVLRDRALIGACSDGDVFIVEGEQRRVSAGQRLPVTGAGPEASWRIPESAPTVPPPESEKSQERPRSRVLATPAAVADADLPGSALSAKFRLGTATPRAVEEVRNAVAEISPLATSYIQGQSDNERQIERIGALVTAGVCAALAVVGLGLLISAVERLRETRRALAVLAASGTAKRTLALAMLVQAVIPLAVGLAVSVAVGMPLGAALLAVLESPIAFDAAGIAATVGAAAVVALSVTALSLPALAASVRPENLRAE